MAYSFYLGRMLLPVTPSALKVKINNKNDTISLINDGEVNIIKKAGLTEIEFECLLPNQQYPFAVYNDGFQDASVFLAELERLKNAQEPFNFIVQRELPNSIRLNDTNISVTIEDYTVTEDAEDFGFDIAVSINLKQFKSYGTKVITLSTPQSEEEPIQATVEEARPTQSSIIGIGSDVIVNGRLHRDSFGSGPGKTLTEYQGKVNFIKTENPYPYHVTTPSGGWLGWVLADNVRSV